MCPETAQGIHENGYRTMAHALSACYDMLARSGGKIGCHKTHGRARCLNVNLVGHVAQCANHDIGVVAVGEIVRHSSAAGKGINYQCPVAYALGCRQFHICIQCGRCFDYILHYIAKPFFILHSSLFIQISVCHFRDKLDSHKSYLILRILVAKLVDGNLQVVGVRLPEILVYVINMVFIHHLLKEVIDIELGA